MLLFMTATLNPPAGVPSLMRTDPAVRLADYCEALRFYCTLDSRRLDRILFIDNSGSDVSLLRQIAADHGAGKQIEIISYPGNTHDPRYGRFYGEFQLMEHGLRTSSLVQPNEQFWKVTGRLRCENFFKMVASAPRRYDLYCDLKRWTHKWTELRLFSCTPRAFRELFLANIERLREDVTHLAPEVGLFDTILSSRSQFQITPRFRIQPRFRGFNAQGNLDLQSPAQRRREVYLSTLRRVAPFFWV